MSYYSSGYQSSGYYDSGYYGETISVVTANYYFSVLGLIDPDGLAMRGKIWV